MPTSDIKKGPLYVDSTNNRVGIGTSSPSGELHVKASSGFAEAYVQGSNSSSGMYLFDQGTEAGLWKVDSGHLAFGTNNAERMRIDSSGNVGIGVTPSAWSVNGVIQTGRCSFVGTPNAAGGTLNYNAYYDGAWKYKDALEATQYNQ